MVRIQSLLNKHIEYANKLCRNNNDLLSYRENFMKIDSPRIIEVVADCNTSYIGRPAF